MVDSNLGVKTASCADSAKRDLTSLAWTGPRPDSQVARLQRCETEDIDTDVQTPSSLRDGIVSEG